MKQIILNSFMNDREEIVDSIFDMDGGFIYQHRDGYYGYVSTCTANRVVTQRVGYSELLLKLLIQFQITPHDWERRQTFDEYFIAFREGRVHSCVELERKLNEHLCIRP